MKPIFEKKCKIGQKKKKDLSAKWTNIRTESESTSRPLCRPAMGCKRKSLRSKSSNVRYVRQCLIEKLKHWKWSMGEIGTNSLGSTKC